MTRRRKENGEILPLVASGFMLVLVAHINELRWLEAMGMGVLITAAAITTVWMIKSANEIGNCLRNWHKRPYQVKKPWWNWIDVANTAAIRWVLMSMIGLVLVVVIAQKAEWTMIWVSSVIAFLTLQMEKTVNGFVLVTSPATKKWIRKLSKLLHE